METTPIIAGELPLALPKTNGTEVSKATRGFEEILSSTIEKVSEAENQGNLAIEKLHTGEAENLHEVMISVEEADVAIRMLVQMRNKALDAYHEIMRLQI